MILFLILSLVASPHIIDLTAGSDYRFVVQGQSNQDLRVKAGEPLLLRITSHGGAVNGRDGAARSLVIRSLRDEGWDVRLREGLQEIPLQAPGKAGTYLIECTVPCGPGHQSMNLKLTVEP